MVSCSSCGCSLTPKHKSAGVTFHNFPKDGNRRTQWIYFVKNPEFIPKSSSVLCSHHFAKDCFDRTSKLKVRLLPNAIPTIEVERLKYVRTFNPVITRPMESVENKLTVSDILLSKSGPSAREQTPSPLLEKPVLELEDTPCEQNLKKKIRDLQKSHILKSHQIRQLQKVNWRQKKQISSLKALILELKNKNLLLEKHENIMIQHFRKDKDIIQVVIKKLKKKRCL